MNSSRSPTVGAPGRNTLALALYIVTAFASPISSAVWRSGAPKSSLGIPFANTAKVLTPKACGDPKTLVTQAVFWVCHSFVLASNVSRISPLGSLLAARQPPLPPSLLTASTVSAALRSLNFGAISLPLMVICRSSRTRLGF